MKKTFKLETIDQCEQVKEYWGDSVIDWDKVSKTVTIEANEKEIQEYFNNQNEIHGWD